MVIDASERGPATASVWFIDRCEFAWIDLGQLAGIVKSVRHSQRILVIASDDPGIINRSRVIAHASGMWIVDCYELILHAQPVSQSGRSQLFAVTLNRLAASPPIHAGGPSVVTLIGVDCEPPKSVP